MKPQMIAKRNAELRRKARETHGEPIGAEMSHRIASPRSARSREVALSISQTAGGILLIFGGIIVMIPALLIIPFIVNLASILVLFLILGVFELGLAIFGGVLIRMGVAMLKSAHFQSRGAPILRNLNRLAYDAAPVLAYVVGGGPTGTHALIAFDNQPDEHAFMRALAGRLAVPGILEELLGETQFVEDRRVRIPVDLTGGRTVYLVDLPLKRNRLTTAVVRCIAESGASGRIVLAE